MNRTAKTVRLLQALAAITGLAIILWSFGLSTKVDAANLTSVSDTLSDSDPSALSDHTINFTIPVGSNGIDAASETIVVTFPAGFDISNLALADIDLEVEGSDHTVVIGAAGANQWQVATSGQNLTFTSGGGTATATATDIVTVKLGTVADGGLNQVTNTGATGSHDLLINVASNQDTGETIIVIIDNVLVTANVDTVFNFSVVGVAGGQTVNGTTTTGTTTATTIPFGKLINGPATTTAQDLTVTTNAKQGFTVSVVADSQLISATGADIDGFSNGSFVTDPTTWVPPSATVGLDDTYGHWGITSDDTDTTARGAEEFASAEFVSASTTPVIVMGNDGPANAIGTGVGTTRVGYAVQISSLQEAADDYESTLTYIATPIF